MAAARHAWPRGARLFVRGAIWRVLEHTTYRDCASLRLRAAQQATPALRTIFLPFDRPRLLPDREAVRVLRPRGWLRRLRAVRATAAPAGGFEAAARNSISILPYQLEPALLIRRHGATRVMIADAVGLGKTIQAGVLLAELAAEHEELRALVVVPAGLRSQWSRELGAHFGIQTVSATSAWLARAASDMPPDVNPWEIPGTYVASSDFIKRPEVLRPLEDVTWDVVIVDEAHEASLGTARGAAVHALACRARRVMLLTATPHAGDEAQFSALCAIGAHDAHSPIVMFKRARADVAPFVHRRTKLFSIRPSVHEQRMHRLLDAYTARLWDEGRVAGDRQRCLVAIVLRKRALSSAASLAASCLRRHTLLEDVGDHQNETQPVLPFADEDPLADAEPDGVLGGQGLADVERERQLLAGIAAAAARASADESKVRFLRRMIARLQEPAIVFTEYRDTLERLRRQLSPLRPDLRILHGGMDPRERERSQDALNAGCPLLIATDAASEGLNLHARCRLVIHFELPWSPAKLEQRTGRVDRFGQSRAVHEVLLVSKDTAERHVLAPLLGRAARSRSSTPYAGTLIDTLAESDIAAAVIAGLEQAEPRHPCPTGPPPFSEPPVAVRDEAVAETARLNALRGPSRSNDALSADYGAGRIFTTSIETANGVPPGLYAVYSITLTADDLRIVHQELAVAHCDVGPLPRFRTGRALRTFADRFRETADDAVREQLLHRYDVYISEIAERWAQAAMLLAKREQAILRSLPSTATQLVQAGLFDQRAIRVSAARSRASALHREEAGRRINALASSSNLEKSAQLRALLVVGRRRA